MAGKGSGIDHARGIQVGGVGVSIVVGKGQGYFSMKRG